MKYEYTVTAEVYTDIIKSLIETPSGFTPKVPEGDDWDLVAFTASESTLFWTWRREKVAL
jgi:hypothetical protein